MKKAEAKQRWSDESFVQRKRAELTAILGGEVPSEIADFESITIGEHESHPIFRSFLRDLHSSYAMTLCFDHAIFATHPGLGVLLEHAVEKSEVHRM